MKRYCGCQHGKRKNLVCISVVLDRNLRRLFLMLHMDGQVTTQRMTTLLNDIGVEIRKRHVGRCLTERLDGFHAEDAAVL